MALYRARWVDPSTGKPMKKLFHSKALANAFRDLPREVPVTVEHDNDNHKERPSG